VKKGQPISTKRKEDNERGQQEKHILQENKNRVPEGKENEPRKEMGLDESHEEN
jgi:hypothetical protein